MALRKCKDCGKPVSSEATACPHCGAPRTPELSAGAGCLAFFLIAGVLAAIVVSQKKSANEPDKSDNSAAVTPQIEKPAPVVSNVESVPAWYHDSTPWSSISIEERQKLLQIRSNYEQIKTKAEEPAKLGASPEAVRGEAIISSICEKYHLDSIYKNPTLFGPRMVIWIPEDAWSNMSGDDKACVATWVSGKYSNWGIGVGQTSGTDVFSDRIVMQH